MSKAIKRSFAISITALCLYSILFTPFTKFVWSQDDTQIHTFINKLKDPDPDVRGNAESALKNIGSEAVPALIKALKDKDKDREVRQSAAGILGYIGPEAIAAVPALIEALKDEDENLRYNAGWTLGEIGPKAKAAVPDLIEVLKDEDKNVRKYIAEALGKIGPDAKAAVPYLIEALKEGVGRLEAVIDPDKYYVRESVVRALASIGPDAVPALVEALNNEVTDVCLGAADALKQIGPDAKAAVPVLIDTLKDKNWWLRDDIVEIIGNIGPDAKAAVPHLIEALKDESRYAAEALGKIGPDAKAAVPYLIEALKDVENELREGIQRVAVEALGNIGSEAKAAVPAIIKILKQENVWVSGEAAVALGKIATALRDAKATDMIKKLNTVKEALSSYPEFEDEKNEVRRAIEYLEQIWWRQYWDNILKWIFRNKLNCSLILGYLFCFVICLIVFWLRPLALLKINLALKPFEFQLPKQLGAIKLPIRFLIFVGFLNYHPRVLNAWVKAYISGFREKFSKKDTVFERQIHISVPVEFDRQTIPDLSPKHLRAPFSRQIGCLLIWGEGGSGKTSLACQIANWAMAENEETRLCEHLMVPVIIEHEISSKEDPSAFTDAVSKQVQDLTDQVNPIPDELLEHLLRKRRILVIVDHLSEMSKDTRDQIHLEKKGFPVNALIVTSRLEEGLGGVTKTVIKPLRIRRDRLSPFMEAYLTHRGKSDIFTDSEFHDACRRLTDMVGVRDLTLLLAKLYAEQLIVSKEDETDKKLPDNIPNLMLTYLNELNRNVPEEDRFENPTLHRYAKVLAWESVKETFRPSAVRISDIVTFIGEGNAAKNLKYLEDKLRLIRTEQPAEDRITFLLDPLAEYLAGLHLIELYGKKENAWSDFINEADAKEGAPKAIKGFLLAVRDCIIAKGKEAKVPDFVANELAKRADLDMEAIERAQKEQRIQRLIDQLGFLEAEDRQQAAEALGKTGTSTKAAVSALLEVLEDKDEMVRISATSALRKIGPDAVPALIEALKYKDEAVRRQAAEALKIIGPEAKSAVPALIEALREKDELVSVSAAEALGQIGLEAKAAVPSLIETLNDEDESVSVSAASALGNIGPETLPALIEALKGKAKLVRQSSASALGNIGAEAKAAVQPLIEALKDEDQMVRINAAQALRKIGPEAVPALIEALTDNDERVRRRATGALGGVGTDAKAAVIALIKALKDEDKYVRERAAEALGKIGTDAKAAVPDLIEVLKDADGYFRQIAAWALGVINTPEAQKALEDYQKNQIKFT